MAECKKCGKALEKCECVCPHCSAKLDECKCEPGCSSCGAREVCKG